MKRSLRILALSFLAATVLLAVMPATVFGAVPPVSLTFVDEWGTLDSTVPYGDVDGTFRYPMDVNVDKWGHVYVAGGTNGDDRVQVFESDGTFITSLGSPDIVMPMSVTTDRWGNVFVGENGNGGRIHTFGGLLSPWNGTFDGSGPSAITSPWGLGASLDGYVYVADSNAVNIQRWTWSKQFMDSTAQLGSLTSGLDVSEDGLVFTTTDNISGIMHSVVVYDWIWGVGNDSWGGFGTGTGQFNRPYDVEVDPIGRSYVIESAGSRGQVFTPDGTYMTTFGSGGSGDGQFSAPYGIAVGPDRTVYVADTFNHRVQRWEVSTPAALDEIAGANRITTAVQASEKAFPDGAPIAVVATAYNWPDALGGAALAGVVNGPILLTHPDALPGEVATEISRLGCEGVYVLGGEDAVSADVYDAIAAIVSSSDTKRLEGPDRYATAVEIAREVKVLRGSSYDGTAFVCTGADFPDALAAAPIAAANGWPIYLTRPDSLLPSVATALIQSYGGNPSNHGYIIGGEAALAPAVETALNSPPFIGYGRYGGANRYDTAATLADVAYNGMGMLWSRPALATGENFPDALAGGALQGDDCSVLLLTRTDSLPSETAAALTANEDMIYELRFLGGTAAISTTVRNQVKTILGLPW
jgi:putative cell wall-binding protein